MTTITSKVTLKKLQSQLSTLEGKRIALRGQVENIQQELTLNKKQIQRINGEIAKLNFVIDKDIEVSEHAIYRYLERVLNIDIEEIKSKIVTGELKALVTVLGGTGTYPVDNFRVKMVNKTITTVLT